MLNPETDQWDIQGGEGEGEGGGGLGALQFKKTEPRTTTTQWTINDVLGDDPMLRPVEFEVSANLEGGSSSGSSTSRTLAGPP